MFFLASRITPHIIILGMTDQCREVGNVIPPLLGMVHVPRKLHCLRPSATDESGTFMGSITGHDQSQSKSVKYGLAHDAANKGKAKQEGGVSQEAILYFRLDVHCSLDEFRKAAQSIGQGWHKAKIEARAGANSVQGCLQLPVAARR